MNEGFVNLQTLWFILLSILWLGYFVLEGFDFGVGALLRILGKDDMDRRVMLNTIGPVWDANEVWLIVAGAGTFAAFPDWYATLFSGFYIALFLILVSLIMRNVALEFRSKRESVRWRNRWDWLIVIGSVLPAVLWGVAWANILKGVPIDSTMEYTGTFWTLLRPYTVFFGVTTLALFTLHGAVFLTLKTTGELQDRARNAARMLAWPATLLVIGTIIWTYVNSYSTGDSGIIPDAAAIAAIVFVGAAAWLVSAKLDGWAFAATAAAILLLFVTVFTLLYPNAIVSSTSAANNLTIFNTSSSTYTLVVMTIVAAIFVPIVLIYTGWTYWVFRARIRRTPTGPQTIDDVLETRRAAKAPKSGSARSGDTEGETGGAKPAEHAET